MDEFSYRKGYWKALLDMRNILDNFSWILSARKLLPKKSIAFLNRLLTGMLNNIDAMIAYGDNVSITQAQDGGIVIGSPNTSR